MEREAMSGIILAGQRGLKQQVQLL